MHARHLIGLSSMLLLLVASAPAAAAAAPGAPVADRYIVVLRDDAVGVPAIADEHARRHGAAVRHVYEHALRGYAATIPVARLADLRRDPRVAFVSEDRPVAAVGQALPTGIDRIQGDVSRTRSGDGAGSVDVGVAIIDTGIDPRHPELNVAGGVNCSTGRGYDDGNGHGTHVAGTVAAKDDGAGVVGVAPSARLYAVRVLNNAGSGSWSSVACGVDWVTANAARLGIRVANLSLGGAGADDGACGAANADALHKAICGSVAAGVTYVVAAGNSGADLAGSVPAAYDEVLTVTAAADFDGRPGGSAAATCRADVDETPADFSNFASTGGADEGHTIAAAGMCIRSTWKGGGYATLSGTSMAAPHVAGAAALCLAGGACGGGPAAVLSTLRADAAAQPAAYGFAGDPRTPLTSGGGNSQTRYYGYLVYAGGY